MAKARHDHPEAGKEDEGGIVEVGLDTEGFEGGAGREEREDGRTDGGVRPKVEAVETRNDEGWKGNEGGDRVGVDDELEVAEGGSGRLDGGFRGSGRF